MADATHKGMLLKAETISDGAVVFHAYCEDDEKNKDGSPRHVSRHTCYVEMQHGFFKTDEMIETEMQEHLTRVEQLHERRTTTQSVGDRYAAQANPTPAPAQPVKPEPVKA